MIETANVKIGNAYRVARHQNADGYAIPVRRADWRTVLITDENLARYTDGQSGYYLFEAVTNARTVHLLAAGWTKFTYGQGECGAEITTPGPLLGLACGKRAFWTKDESVPECDQHAIMHLA